MQRTRAWMSNLIVIGMAACGLSAWVAAAAGDVPIVEAARRGDKETVRLLLKQSVDVNTAQGDGMTALHWAAMNNDAELARMLVYAGANVRAATRVGAYTPLLLAANEGHAAMVQALLNAGADPRVATTTGATTLMLAAAAGSREAVKLLLDRGAEVNARESGRGETALMFAAASNRPAVIEMLLQHGGDPTIATKVVDVAAIGKAEAAERAKSGRGGNGLSDDPDAPAEGGRAGSRGQNAAAEKEDAKAAGTKPAAVSGAEASKAVRPGGKPANATGAEGETARQGNRGFARAAPYYELVGTQGGLTPLLFAARQGHLEAVRALLDGGADVNQVSPGDKTSPLVIATINGHFDCATFLLDHGANPKLANAAGTTALYAAINVQWAPHAFYPQPSPAQDRATYLELMKALLDHGADPNVRLAKKVWHTGYNFDQSGVDETGATALWRAAQADDLAAIKLLVSYHADPSIPTKVVPERQSPNGSNQVNALSKEEAEKKAAEDAKRIGGPAVNALHAATGAGWDGNYHVNAPGSWMPAVKYLVEELHFDVNAADDKGNTPLHNAAARGDNEMILYLVSKGADAKAVNKAGQTTADMANGPKQRIQPFPETVKLLESLGSKNNHKCVSC